MRAKQIKQKSTHKASKGIPTDWSHSNPETRLTSGFVRFCRSSAYKGSPLQGGGRWFETTSAHEKQQVRLRFRTEDVFEVFCRLRTTDPG